MEPCHKASGSMHMSGFCACMSICFLMVEGKPDCQSKALTVLGQAELDGL